MARALRRQGLAPTLIIDGGANVGQFARAMVETFPEAHVHSFEPLPDVAAEFRRHLGDHPRVTLHETALGASEGTIPFFRNDYTLASSALPSASGDQPVEQLEVRLSTLDAVMRDVEFPPSALLKLDLQGYELEALRGGPATLDRMRHVLLEIALRPAYVGEPPFEALYDFMRAAGFRFLRPVEVLQGPGREIVQMDALFERIRPEY